MRCVEAAEVKLLELEADLSRKAKMETVGEWARKELVEGLRERREGINSTRRLAEKTGTGNE